MACIALNITQVEQAAVAVSATPSSSIAVRTTEQVGIVVTHGVLTSVVATPTQQPSLAVVPVPQMSLVVGEVCTIGSGRLVVLAAQDGPLRLRGGGYILLNPATNPAEA